MASTNGQYHKKESHPYYVCSILVLKVTIYKLFKMGYYLS